MRLIDWVVLCGFLLVHMLTTVAIGLWLNRMARKEIATAVEKVASGLEEKFPILSTFAGNGTGNKVTDMLRAFK